MINCPLSVSTPPLPPWMMLFIFKFFRHLHPLLAHSFSFWGFRFQTGIHFRASLSAAGRLLSGRFCLYSPAALLLQTPLRMLPSPHPPSHSEHIAISQKGFSFSSSSPALFLLPKCLFPQGVVAQNFPVLCPPCPRTLTLCRFLSVPPPASEQGPRLSPVSSV